MWATVGYFARRFIGQQAANHKDTEEAVRTLHKISEELPRLGFRISRLEMTALVGGAIAAYYAWRQKTPGSM